MEPWASFTLGFTTEPNLDLYFALSRNKQHLALELIVSSLLRVGQ
jgi:hypothetical protein